MKVSFPVIGFFSSFPNEWNLSDPSSAYVAIDPLGRTEIAKVAPKPIYIVHFASASDFRQLSNHAGVPVAPDAGLSLRVSVEARAGALVRTQLLEYDRNGARIGQVDVPNESTCIFVPRSVVTQVVLAIRVSGSGTAVVDEVDISSLPTTADLPSGLHVLPGGGEGHAVPATLAARLNIGATEVEQLSRSLRTRVDGLVTDLQSLAASAALGAGPPGGDASTQDFVQELLVAMAESLPASNGSHYFARPLPYRVAIVTDEYMFNFYRDAFDETVYVGPADVSRLLETDFDLFLFVTCWRGLRDDEWQGLTHRPVPALALEQIIAHCRAQKIPTVFQSIEDPSNFDHFLPVARMFDHVFTSDVNCIVSYREALGHDRVHYGEYGANPLINNPIGSNRFSINRAFFAGSYPERYPDRCHDMEMIFDAILQSGAHLQIADRNGGARGLEFPERFRPYLMEPLSHELLQRVHKIFRYSLNFNSIKSSPTMCAMRVYELQAQGRGLISNYSKSVLNRFPEIRIVVHPEDLSYVFEKPISHGERRANEQLIRNVMSSTTSFEVAAGLLERIGLNTYGVAGEPWVAVLGDFGDEHVSSTVARQSYRKLVRIDLGEDRGEALRAARSYRYWTHVDPDVDYGPHYVEDRLNAFKYVDVGFVTQSAQELPDGSFNGLVHEFYAGPVDAGLTLFATDRVDPSTFVDGDEGTVTQRRDGYVIPPYQAQRRRRGEAPIKSARTNTPELSIVVPVHNNGRFLRAKCFPSIQRNRRWQRFEILLVDDGSSDEDTVRACADLASEFVNVRCLRIGDEPSGSASKPRNQGIEHATAPLVAFLDPDNEISDGGYDQLLELFADSRKTHPQIGFVSGFQVKVTDTVVTTGRHTVGRSAVVEDARACFFEHGKFPVVSTQAAVIDRGLLGRGRLEFVEGAAGQDTLFGWELLLSSPMAVFTDAAHLIYYAERSDSITNVLGAEYFRKMLVMEAAQAAWLKSTGLLDVYVDHHLRHFVRGWYLPRLAAVDDSERDESEKALRRILELYGVQYAAMVEGDTEPAPTGGSAQ